MRMMKNNKNETIMVIEQVIRTETADIGEK